MGDPLMVNIKNMVKKETLENLERLDELVMLAEKLKKKMDILTIRLESAEHDTSMSEEFTERVRKFENLLKGIV